MTVHQSRKITRNASANLFEFDSPYQLLGRYQLGLDNLIARLQADDFFEIKDGGLGFEDLEVARCASAERRFRLYNTLINKKKNAPIVRFRVLGIQLDRLTYRKQTRQKRE